MTLAAIIAEHSANLPHPTREGVATCGVQTVGTPSATPATPATPKKQTHEVRAQTPSNTVQSSDVLKAERARLLELAAAEVIDAAHVHRLKDADLAECLGLDDGQRRVFLRMMDDTAERHAGRVPLDDTAAMYCERCGPVWTHPDIAESLPVVKDWPRALGCPWCFVRKAGGYIPRPPVACCDCQHFTADALNREAGIGTCTSDHGSYWAGQRHACAAFQPDKEPTV
ncbi:hypothetical protein PY254_10725 [Rhodanobacter sp. AS-Z3]|uniref:hypothetical protein n=1 Tax=Rhodanobacter sp. AS-Z3 TaxID=3031330 RepID=UPI0024785599|nr:hypothetical protein [Rhodanobacter sp. AS-Z3]WEN13719.1 hypothetical protein PY254_10725 [Rhodanobacter sp. AS-Z3]